MGSVPTPAVFLAGMILVGVILVGVGDGILAPSQKSIVNRLSSADQRAGSNSAALMFQNVGKVVEPVGVRTLLHVVGTAPAFVILGVLDGGIGVVTLTGVVVLQEP